MICYGCGAKREARGVGSLVPTRRDPCRAAAGSRAQLLWRKRKENARGSVLKLYRARVTSWAHKSRKIRMGFCSCAESGSYPAGGGRKGGVRASEREKGKERHAHGPRGKGWAAQREKEGVGRGEEEARGGWASAVFGNQAESRWLSLSLFFPISLLFSFPEHFFQIAFCAKTNKKNRTTHQKHYAPA